MFNKFLILLTISLLTVFTLNSCDDDPTSLGDNLLPEQDFINVIKITSADTTFDQKARFYDTDTLALNSSARVLLGKTENVESTILMKFYMFLPDSIRDAISADSLIIKSAVLEMEPIYSIGEGTLDFSIFEITTDWNSLEFSKYDLPELTYNNVDLGSNYQNFDDTLLTCDFDKDMIMNWMNLSVTEIQEENYGIYFNYNSGTDKIIGFPAISTLYDSTLTRLKIIVDVIDKFTDTLTIPVTSDAHVVLGELPVSNNGNIFVQGGIPVRANMYFDLSLIPNYAIINKATLKLSIDESESLIGSNSADLISIMLLEDYETSDILKEYPRINLEKDSLESFYTGEITPYVQYWVTNENQGFQLYQYDEIETVNKVALGTEKSSNEALKPYLEIIYTSKK